MAVRAKLNLDKVDRQNDPVDVVVPKTTYSVNSSFFLGMFGPSIVHFRSRDAFLKHYVLRAPDHVRDELSELVDRTLSSQGPLAVG